MALTRITKGVIKPNENYDTHNINSTGIVTAIGLDVNGNGDISGNLSVGGVLTYEDVTSIDSVGIITAQKDIHVGAGISVVGVGSFGSLDISGDIDVDGHTNLDNVNIVGVTTISQNLALNASGTTYPLVVHADADYKGIMVNGSYAPTIGFNILDNYTPSWKLGIHGGSHHNFAISSGTGNTNKLIIQGASNGGKGLFYGDWFATNLTMASTLYHDGDTDTGITFSGLGDIINLHTATTTRLSVQNSGIIVTGISTFSASAHVSNVSGSVFFGAGSATAYGSQGGIGRAGGANYHIGSSAVGDLCIAAEGSKRILFGTKTGTGIGGITKRMSIASNGQVTIDGNLDAVGGIDATANSTFARDLSVDGHTNLDNVSVTGVTTFTGNVDVDAHTHLDNVNISGVTTFASNVDIDGNTTFGANGSLTSAANFNLSSNGLVIVGSQTVIEAKKAGNATIQCTDTSNNTDLQLRANSEGGLVRTASNYPLILGAYQIEKLRIDGGAYSRIGINTSTFDTAGSQIKIEGRGAGTTSPPYLQIKGVGNANLHSYIDLIATSDSNAGNSYRGLGIVMHDEPTNVEWFAGRPYAGSDKYIIGRKSPASYRTESSAAANQFFQITSDGRVGIDKPSNVSAKLNIGDTNNDAALSQLIKLGNDSSGAGTGSQINMGLVHGNESTSACIAGFLDSDGGTSFIVKTAGTYANQSTVTQRLLINSGGQLIHKANKASGYVAEFHQDHANNSAQILIDSPTNSASRPAYIELSRASTLQWSIGQGYNESTGSFHFATSTLGSGVTGSKFSVEADGDISIPTVGAKIYTNNSGGNLTIQGGASYPGSAIKFNGGHNGGTGNMHLYAGQTTSLQERMTIAASGRIGMSQTSPDAATLHIGNSVASTSSNIALQVGTITGQNRYLAINHFNNQQNFYQVKMRVNDNGKVPMVDLGNPYAGAGYGCDIKFHGPGEVQTGGIEVVNQNSSGANAKMIFRINDGSTVDKECLQLQSNNDVRVYNGLNIAKIDNDSSNFSKSGLVLSTPTYNEYHYVWGDGGNGGTGQAAYKITLTCGSYFHSEFIYTQHQTNGGNQMHTYARGKWANNHTTHTGFMYEFSGAGSGLTHTFTVSDQNDNGTVDLKSGLTAAGTAGATHRGFYGGGSENVSSGTGSATGKFVIDETRTYNTASTNVRGLIIRVYFGSFSISKSTN